MATTRLTDVIVPETFTAYVVQNTLQKTALIQSGAVVPNSAITDQLRAGAESFNIPYWLDLGDTEANIVNDDPAVFSTPLKLTSGKQIVRKSFLHNSWAAMNRWFLRFSGHPELTLQEYSNGITRSKNDVSVQQGI